MLKIDKGIPLPNRKVNKYPWKEMEVGDSFFSPDETLNLYANTSAANRNYAPKQFVCRKVDKGWRIWRTS